MGIALRWFDTSLGRRCLAVAAVALVSHATALGGGFVWLDHAHIEGGLALAPVGQMLSLFQHGFAGTGFYRPLMSISLSLDAALGGSPLLFHATTLLWHAAAAVSVVCAAEALRLSPRAATFAGSLFAVHPATSLVANAIAFRSEAMLAVWLLWLVVFHARRQPILAGVALLAGALTKETALLVGPLWIAGLTIVEHASRARDDPALQVNRDRRPWLKTLAAEAIACLVAGGLRAAFAPAWRAHFPDLSLGEKVGTRLAVLTRSLLAVVPPFDRSACDSFPVVPVLGPRSLVGAAVALALLWIVRRREAPPLLLALALLPALHVVPIARWWSLHYLYLPLAPVAMWLAQLIDRRRFVFGTSLAVAALSLVSLQEGRRYRSDEVFWTAELAAQPACREAHFYVAEGARARGDWAEAARGYQSALLPMPGILSYVDRTSTFQNLGVVRLAQGDLGAAFAAFENARDLTNDESARRELSHNMAVVALRAGRPADAVRLLAPEVSRSDVRPETLFVYAKALRSLRRNDEAAAVTERLRREGPRANTH